MSLRSSKILSSRSVGSLCRRFSSYKPTNEEETRKRTVLFDQEQARQASLLTRLEKIKVEHKGPPEDCHLIMNKHLSTPFNCAMHIQELLMQRSVLATVNGIPWDMHRPINSDCELRFLHFKDEDPHICNEAFWRTGSFLLGYILEHAFKDQYHVELCSFPRPDVKSGSFVYDVHLPVDDWKPTQAELNCMSRIVGKMSYEDLRFERLDVDASFALKMFEHNRFKTAQIPAIAAKSESGYNVSLYRVGDHVDITGGPLISSTSQLYRFAVTAIHDIESPSYGPLKRIQGVGIPKQLPIHFYTFGILCDRGSRLNTAPLPALKDYNVAVAENGAS